MSKKILVVLMVIGISIIAAAQPGFAQDSVTYENPLVYIGEDNNLYITNASGGVGTAITNDAIYDPNIGNYIFYRTSSWSPDGQTLIFGESESATLYMLKSGEAAAMLNVEAEDVHTAWSPDGTQMAYFGFLDEQPGVLVVPAEGGEPTFWAGGLEFSIGEGPLSEPAVALLARERGDNPLRSSRYLAWLPNGIFYGSMGSRDCYGSAIVQADGTLLCTDWWVLPPFAISPDGSRIIGISLDFVRPIELTFTANQSNPSDIPAELILPVDAIPLAWSADGLYYWTSSDTIRVESEWQVDYFEYSESTLTLWLAKLDGSPDTKIYETRGYGIGRVALPPSDELPLVVSIVTSDVAAAEAFNNGASKEEADAMRSHTAMVALQAGVENSAPLWTLRGGQPLYGRGSFTVVPSAE
ncbi:MAG: hypothetical protein BroJett018_47430 [Chloroflexota bacterium]|nr:MAG: hypothetical protein BroJett018_47430 [Chloroflexota bacterium]